MNAEQFNLLMNVIDKKIVYHQMRADLGRDPQRKDAVMHSVEVERAAVKELRDLLVTE